MSGIDRARLDGAARRGDRSARSRPPGLRRARGPWPRVHAVRRPDELDGQVARRVPGARRRGVRGPFHVRRRPRPRGPVPGRHRCDVRPLARTHRSRPARPGVPRADHDAAEPGRGAGRRRADPTVRRGAVARVAVAVHPHRHRRQPARDPLRAARVGPTEGGGGRLLLPRQRRRDLRLARRRAGGRSGAARSAPRSRRRRPPPSCRSTTSARSRRRSRPARSPPCCSSPR